MTQSLAIPGAIVVAGVLIAGAVTFSSGASSAAVHDAEVPTAVSVSLPDSSDHVRGNSEGKVTIVEFSDYECPFCARFHPTLERIVAENDDVRWVFRHFPLSSIHSRAEDAAIAAECIATLAGNDAFWKSSDELFKNQRDLGDALYARLAREAGIDEDAFNSCRDDSKIASAVSEDGYEAVAAGGRGTPFSVLINASGASIPFSGALPYEDVKRLVEQARTN